MSFYDDGIRFECQRCGRCCTCEGYVFMFEKDLRRLIENEGYTREELQRSYLSTFRGYTVLRDKANNECIFWDNEIKGCKVYKNRPTQCQTYPFWNNVFKSKEAFLREKEDCPGIGKGRFFSKEEIDNLKDKY